MTFKPSQPFDLDPFLKVTAAICKLTLPNLNWGTNLIEAGNHNVFAVLLFAYLWSTSMLGFRSVWPKLRSQKVKIPPIWLHVFQVFFQILSFLHRFKTWFLAQHRAFSSAVLMSFVFSGVCLAVRLSSWPSICKQDTNCNYWSFKALIMHGQSLGGPHTTCLKLGQCDLYIQFYRPKFTYPMYSNGNKISL